MRNMNDVMRFENIGIGFTIRYILTMCCICVLLPKDSTTVIEFTAIFLILSMVKK